MPLFLVEKDITRMEVDAIVNAANNSLLGGGGVDGCIHNAAGPELLAECRLLNGCETGSAKITGAGKLPCRHVIHAVGPVYNGGQYGERELLASCYRTSLMLALQAGCRSIAFPLISSGVYGYPKDEALCVAMDTIAEFLQTREMEVIIVIYNKDYDLCIGNSLQEELQAALSSAELQWGERAPVPPVDPWSRWTEDFLKNKMISRGLSKEQLAPRANFSFECMERMRGGHFCSLEKNDALALAVALELSLEETKELLATAGHSLSAGSVVDVITASFISRGVYNIHLINAALFAFEQNQLGLPA